MNTKNKIEDEIVMANISDEAEDKAKRRKKKVFKDSDNILCRSVWSGGLHVTCKSGMTYDFKDYGAECDIEYRDLVYLVRKHSDHIFTPRFVILNEDFVNEFPQINEVYSGMYSPTELHTILELPVNDMKSEIEKLPETTQKTLLGLAATEVAKGRIDSIKRVKALSEIFKSDFNLLSELFSG